MSTGRRWALLYFRTGCPTFVAEPVHQILRPFPSDSFTNSLGQSILQPFRLFVHPSMSLPVRPSVSQSVREFDDFSVRKSVGSSVHLSLSPSESSTIFRSVSPSARPSVSSSAYPYLRPFIYKFWPFRWSWTSCSSIGMYAPFTFCRTWYRITCYKVMQLFQSLPNYSWTIAHDCE